MESNSSIYQQRQKERERERPSRISRHHGELFDYYSKFSKKTVIEIQINQMIDI